MAIDLGRWEALIHVPTGGWSDSGNFTLTEAAGGGAVDITITAGDYFWHSGVDGGNTFLAQIKADLEFYSANGQIYTVSMTADETTRTQIVTITSGAAFELAFGSNDGQTFLDLLGTTNDPSGSSTSIVFSDNNAEAIWLPDQPVWTPTAIEHTGFRRRVQSLSRSPAGTFHRWVGAKTKQKQYVYRGCAKDKIIAEFATIDNEAFERFWDHSIGAEKAWSVGTYWRFYADADVDGAYKSYYPITDEPQIERLAKNYRELWNLTLDVQTVNE